MGIIAERKNYICTIVNIRFLIFFFLIYDSHREREREIEAETQAEGEAGSMHREPDTGLNPRSPGSCPGLKTALNC